MKKFKYENDGTQIHMEAADMDMEELAAEVGRITQHLFTSLHNQEPMAALHFKMAMMVAIAHPASPVWVPQKVSEGSSTMIMLGKQ